MTQIDAAKDELETQNEESAASLITTLPSIESFSEIASILPEMEMTFVASAVSFWNAMRRAEPHRIPSIQGIDMSDQLIQYRIFLRKPLVWIREPKEVKLVHSKIREIITPKQ